MGEYGNIMGMIPSVELPRRRIKSVQKLMKVGKQMPAKVLNVDIEKAYIDLSINRLSTEQSDRCDDRYRKSKLVHSIMSYISDFFQKDLEELYKKIAWPLTRIYGHAHDAFKLMLQNRNEVFEKLEEKPEEVVCDELFKIVEQKIIPLTFKVSAEVEMTCFEYDGVLAIKKALRAAHAAGLELLKKVEMKLVAAPNYTITTLSNDKKTGIDTLNYALQACKKVIESFNGSFTIKICPCVAGARDDKTASTCSETNASSCE